jgi:hypothetical protein
MLIKVYAIFANVSDTTSKTVDMLLSESRANDDHEFVAINDGKLMRREMTF